MAVPPNYLWYPLRAYHCNRQLLTIPESETSTLCLEIWSLAICICIVAYKDSFINLDQDLSEIVKKIGKCEASLWVIKTSLSQCTTLSRKHDFPYFFYMLLIFIYIIFYSSSQRLKHSTTIHLDLNLIIHTLLIQIFFPLFNLMTYATVWLLTTKLSQHLPGIQDLWNVKKE